VSKKSDAFLSYTRIDDEFFGGAITSLRKLLERGVQVVTGHADFNIFQDVDGIEFGQNWQKRLDEAIASTRFLIPFITPLFFQSKACRDELEKFFDHERKVGRDDLILPVYFFTAPVLEKKELLQADSLAIEISKRQRYDWRSKADLPITDAQIRSAVIDLSQKIAAAISRTEVNSGDPKVRARDSVPEAMRILEVKKAAEVVKDDEGPRIKFKEKTKRTILWVDDRPSNNVFERQAMQPYNIEFDLAKSTGEALAKLRRSTFDAIISDMGRPPDMQAGYTLLEALRQSGDTTPYFIYAGSDSPSHRKLARSKGAQWSTNRADVLIGKIIEALDK
jgi:CheY-like chemotaxis protein